MNRYFLTHRKIDVALLIGAVAVAPLVYGGVWLGPITKVAKVIPARGARISSALDTPFDLDIVASAGVCPRGLKVGDRIAVDEAGGLSVSLCRVAIAAIDRVGTSKASANCVCPLEDQRMTFAIAAIAL